jgi:hypothetical protein
MEWKADYPQTLPSSAVLVICRWKASINLWNNHGPG